VVIEYNPRTTAKASLRIKDYTGRNQQTEQLGEGPGQWVLDTRSMASGAYTVELLQDGKVVAIEKLILL
jgi:hypothetical protein